MPSPEELQRAQKFLQEALREQMARRYEAAVALYKESLAICPTAEAHTFLGWAYSFLGRLDEAILECRRAISVDPDFGNPYNDIGSYLMMQGRMQEAIAWLERAKTARRYEPKHYPYLNLGRLYTALGRFEEARREFSQARFIFDEIVASGTMTEGAAADDDGAIH